MASNGLLHVLEHYRAQELATYPLIIARGFDGFEAVCKQGLIDRMGGEAEAGFLDMRT